ncbi:N-acetylglucosamine repressor [Roseibaca ekhonensis]|jgi:predicted NBD/HSP70 family sugar kinase|uniref:N-acetylglucosamine repressor n=1 Tax=Roseinatronobacter ekhonensis TaxID=254356 RepID=A0A3B0MBH0_9RHOB|nr:ROK family transcriptional regulator [Roseibaca ekhonensis]SUZ33275.1 N-acetylglucosamine repressor [Roseibaca ekhonensis]
MEDGLVRSISTGLSQKGVRDHNERLLLSLLQRHGPMPGSDLSKLAELSPPTVSSILRRLESEGILERGDPTRGKVGKPSIPMRLAPNGVFSFGLKIGRRSADLVLIDLTGELREERRLTYAVPSPDDIFDFLEEGVRSIIAAMDNDLAARVCGIGIAAPFEMWNWHDPSVDLSATLSPWEHIDFRLEAHARTGLPVLLLNDATAACQAEHTYGRGKEFQDYAYFFIGAFIGGGVVLNNSVFEGRQGNAGALGSLRSIGPNGESRQLVDMASIHQLEMRLREVDLDPQQLWSDPESWHSLSRYVDPWLGQTAQELAKAALSTCSVIDFEAILIDGAFPASVRDDLVNRVRRYVVTQDTRGLIPPRIESGSIGGKARAIGAATRPIGAQFMMQATVGGAA